MKAVILAGGLGTRISEETTVRPKPMVEVGGKPIIWHIMKMYSQYGINDFIICCGYKGYVIKEYFANYMLHVADVTFDIKNNKMKLLHNEAEPWTIALIDTGETSMTGGRLKRVASYLDEGTFCMTYGDGVCDVNIKDIVDFHKTQGTKATLMAAQQPGRFGAFTLEESHSKVACFREKPKGDGAWVNGGFFVLEPSVIDYIDNDSTVWEQQPLEKLAKEGNLSAFRHSGFWQPMDTLRDKCLLEDLWQAGSAPWKVWS
jgi:glucose-1-phosphate cytidylyltransferase